MTKNRLLCHVIARVGAVFAILLVAGIVVESRAQRYPSKTYTETDGLPSASVRGILQGSAGQIWVATRAGVARYDGLDWFTYGRDSELSSQDVGQVQQDSAGRIWTVASKVPVRVAWLEGEAWHALPQVAAASKELTVVNFAVALHEGRTFVLVATDGGWLHFWNGSEWAILPSDGSTPRAIQFAIEPVRGRFLVGSERGLELLDPLQPADGLTTVTAVPSGGILGIEFDPTSGQTWLIGADWVGKLDNGRIVPLATDLVFRYVPQIRITATAHDRFGGIYFGTPFTLHYFHPRFGLESLGTANGLISEGASGILVDREDNVWVAGMRGITKITSRRFAGFSRDHGLYADEVSAVLETRSGKIVLGHPGGLTFFDDQRRTMKLGDDLTGRALDLAESKDGTLWVAAGWTGLVEIRPDGKVLRHRKWDAGREVVWTVLVDRTDRLWVGVNDALYAGVPGEFERIDVPFPSAPSSGVPASGMIRRLFEGANGTIYVATGGHGLFILRNGEIEHAVHPTDGLANRIYAVLENPDSELLVGSGAGLLRYVSGRLERVRSPLIERPVYFIVRDADRRLWFGTDVGVRRWDGTTLDAFTARTDLIGSETNRAAGVLDRRGRLWIGTDRGVSVYRAEWDRPRLMGPTVELLDVEAGGRIYPATSDHELPGDHGGLLFRFRAISFVDEARVRYRYRLDPLEQEWVGPISIPQREIRYALVPPGEYRLHLQAIDSEQRISDEVVSSRIVIARPLWMRPWVIALELLAVAGLFFGLVSYLTQRRHARRLTDEVREKTRELRSSERIAAQEKERLAVTLSSIVEGVVATDRSGRIVLWNPAAERITGRGAGEMLHKEVQQAICELLPPDLAAKERGEAELRREFSGDKVSIVAADGTPRVLQVSAARIQSDDEAAGVVYAFRDTTDSDRMEEELNKARRLESLGLLAGGIAHDFNNLLATMVSSLSLIELAEGLGDQDRDNLQVARSAAIKARALTNQLLTFARGGAPTRRPVSIAVLVQEATTFALRGASVKHTMDLVPDLWAVDVDDGQMGQVIQNLVLNARQAMPNGGTVRVRGRNVDCPPSFLPEARYVLMEVEDQGEGISDVDLGRIFDPYFSTKKDGVGLGLATAYSIVKRHEGRITVESTEGKGSKFRIWLPASGKGPEPDVDVAALEGECKGRILVMDDQASFRNLVEQILKRQGFTTQGTGDGRDAVEMFRESRAKGEPFDLLLLDLTVPGGVGGVEALAEVRAIDASQPAIAMSGYSNDPVLANPSEYGFQGGLAKPFELPELLRVVTLVLKVTTARES